jgi:segregation and condensation protein B
MRRPSFVRRRKGIRTAGGPFGSWCRYGPRQPVGSSCTSADPVARRHRRFRHWGLAFLVPADPCARSAELARLEAVLFAAQEPLTTTQLARQARLGSAMRVRQLLKELVALYDRDGSPFTVRPIAGGWQLVTRKDMAPWLQSFFPPQRDLKLSQAARETLAIIAYRQPIMRAEIEAVRGVSCGEVIRQLMERGLVCVVGHHESLGRPALYGTTRFFLQALGLPSLRDLPQADRLREPAHDRTAERSRSGR